MPKTRRRNNRKDAKSISVRIKHKIGGRKSTKGVKQMNNAELGRAFRTTPRARNKIKRELGRRWFNDSNRLTNSELLEFLTP